MGILSSLPLKTVAFASVVSIGQNCWALRRSEEWSGRQFDLNLKSMRINVLNTIREETRDQLSRIIASLDNLMLVATLMLSFGFGFVVEGTFPPSEKEYGGTSGLQGDDVQTVLLHVYIVLCALVLICPFFTMMLALLMRQEVDKVQSHIMISLKNGLSSTLQMEKEREKPDGHRRSSKSVLPRRSKSSRENAAGFLKEQVARYLDTLSSTETVAYLKREDDWQSLKVDLHRKLSTYHKFFPVAQFFLWCGIFCGMLLVSVLLGLYLHHNFPDLPWLSYLYSFSVTFAAFGSLVFLGCYGSILFRTKSEMADDGNE